MNGRTVGVVVVGKRSETNGSRGYEACVMCSARQGGGREEQRLLQREDGAGGHTDDVENEEKKRKRAELKQTIKQSEELNKGERPGGDSDDTSVCVCMSASSVLFVPFSFLVCADACGGAKEGGGSRVRRGWGLCVCVYAKLLFLVCPATLVLLVYGASFFLLLALVAYSVPCVAVADGGRKRGGRRREGLSISMTVGRQSSPLLPPVFCSSCSFFFCFGFVTGVAGAE